MKVIVIEEASIECRAQLLDVSTPEETRFSGENDVVELKVTFLVKSDEVMHSSISNAVTALRQYLDEQPLPT